MAEDFVVVCANIIRRDDSILMVQEGKEAAEGKWNLPAGRLEPGESPEDCAQREAQEETGVNVFPEAFVGAHLGKSDISDGSVLVLVYHSSILSGDPKVPDDDDVQDVEFVPIDRLSERELRSSYIETVVEDWQDGKTYPLSAVQRFR